MTREPQHYAIARLCHGRNVPLVWEKPSPVQVVSDSNLPTRNEHLQGVVCVPALIRLRGSNVKAAPKERGPGKALLRGLTRRGKRRAVVLRNRGVCTCVRPSGILASFSMKFRGHSCRAGTPLSRRRCSAPSASCSGRARRQQSSLPSQNVTNGQPNAGYPANVSRPLPCWPQLSMK